jgi:hypothetical protein
MIKNFEELKTLSEMYNVPKEDILFMDMNLSGLNTKEDLDRVRFALKLDIDNGIYDLASRKRIEDYYFALPVKADSNYHVEKGQLIFKKDTIIGKVGTLTEDFCDSSYSRRGGTVLNINPNARTSCRGCKFCYTAYQTARKSLEEFFDKWLFCHELTDLSHVLQIAIVTGCFDSEEDVVKFLLLLNDVLKKYLFSGEIFYLGSQITTRDSLEKLLPIKKFGYCISLECFENREYFLRDKKRKFTLENIMDTLSIAKKFEFRTNFTYIVGLEELDTIKKNFENMVPYINSFPIINIFQEHKYHKGIRHKKANNMEYYLQARKIMEEIFLPTEMRPRPWEDYRSLWYLKFANEELDDVRTP